MRGVQGPTVARIELAAKVRALRDEGWTHDAIGARLGISRSYSSSLDTDPDGSQARARKDSYSQPCPECGDPMTGSDGPNVVPDRCDKCARAKAHDERRWTPESVVAAIHRFVAVHGRPPVADEWINTDSDNGYPCRSAIYSWPGAPFSSWSEAIEAAGYPRPNTGRRTQREMHMANDQNRYGYVILRENDDGAWEVVAERDEPTQVAALNAALNGTPPEGRWVAVPGKSWRPRTLKPRTIYDFVEETAGA